MEKYTHDNHLCVCGHAKDQHLRTDKGDGRRPYCTRRDCQCRSFVEETVIKVSCTLRGEDAKEWIRMREIVEGESGKIGQAEFLRRFVRAALKRMGRHAGSAIR